MLKNRTLVPPTDSDEESLFHRSHSCGLREAEKQAFRPECLADPSTDMADGRVFTLVLLNGRGGVGSDDELLHAVPGLIYGLVVYDYASVHLV